MRTLLRGPVGCACVCVWRMGEEYKLVFNFTKGGFWLSQSIFPPTPVHHNYQPVARGRAHNKQGGGIRDSGRAAAANVLFPTRFPQRWNDCDPLRSSVFTLRDPRFGSSAAQNSETRFWQFHVACKLHVTFTRHVSSFRKKKTKKRVCHNVERFLLFTSVLSHFW